jgi:hypothetical protein
MPDPTTTEGFADMTVGVARTLAVICRHLIDASVIEEDVLIADLVSTAAELEARGVSPIASAVPVGLVAMLRQSRGGRDGPA